jgi:hypothetical protein
VNANHTTKQTNTEGRDTIHLTLCKEGLDEMMSGLKSISGVAVKKEYQ